MLVRWVKLKKENYDLRKRVQELDEEVKSLWLMLDEIKASDINNFREMLEQETAERLAEGAAIIHSSKSAGDLLN